MTCGQDLSVGAIYSDGESEGRDAREVKSARVGLKGRGGGYEGVKMGVSV